MTHHEFVIDLVQRAGKVLRTSATHLTTGYKGGDERAVLTSADLEVNTFIVNEIKRAYPDHRMYSEEGPSVAEALEGKEGSEVGGAYEWAIDPIDGSANFSRGIPHFAIAVGLLHEGRPATGAVYNPITNDLFSFDEKGAYLNGSPIRVSDVREASKAQGLLVVGHQAPLYDWGTAVFRSFLEHLKKLKMLGSSTLDLCFVAAGRADVVVYGTLTTYDLVAALGVLRAAGGDVYTLDGTPAALSKEPQTIVATANRELFESVRPLLHAELLPH